MKYISTTEPFKVQICTKDVPKPGKREALLKMRFGGICGTDLSIYRGVFAYAGYPRIPGHEISAEIVEIPENAQGLKPGMLVTANPYFNCGKCYSCQRGLVNCCMSNETLGAQRDGAYSEYFTMPIDRLYSGEGIDPKILALIEPFCISFHGVKRGTVKKGDKVLVIGAGAIGVLAAISAKHFGAEVHMCDVSAPRLKYAQGFGIDGIIENTSKEALTAKVAEITHGNGFDVVVEAVGLPSTFQDCVDSAAFGGRVVLIGISKKKLDFDFNIIQKKELNVFGSRNAVREDFLSLIELVRAKKFDLSRVITHTYAMDDAAKALDDLDKRGGDMLKAVLEF